MAPNDKKPDLSDLKARLGLTKSAPPKEAESGPPGAGQQPSGPPGQQGPAGGGPPGQQGPAGQGQAARDPGGQQPGGQQPGGQQQPAPQPGAGGPPGGQAGAQQQGAPHAQQPGGPQPGGPQPGGPAAQGPPPGAGGPPGGDGPPGGGAPTGTGPAGSTSGGAAKTKRSSRTRSHPEPQFDMDVDIGGGEDIDSGSVFSPPVLVAMAVCALIGAIFAGIYVHSSTQRTLYNKQTEDAASIRDALKPKLEEFRKLHEKVMKLNPNEVDFEAAKQLAEMEFAAGGNLLASNRLLLGAEIIDHVTSYSADSTLLKARLDNHARMTTGVDKEELEALMKENEVLKEQAFGVIFDYKDALRRGGEEGYEPKKGKLVAVKEFKKEDGKVAVQMLNSERTTEVPVQGVVPLDKGQILKSGGQNALQRYSHRVKQVQFHADKMSKYIEPMMKSLNEMADRDSAPILQF